jgi:hypothetical protein
MSAQLAGDLSTRPKQLRLGQVTAKALGDCCIVLALVLVSPG